MSTLTPNGLPYSALGDSNNPPADIQALALAADARYGLTVANFAALSGISAPFAGMSVWVTTPGDLYTYDGSTWLAGNLPVTASPAFIVERAAFQNMTNNVEATISFDTEVLDTDGMFAATSTDVTVQTDGLWLLTARFGYDPNSTALRTGLIYVNGSIMHREDRAAAPSSSEWAMTTTYETPLTAGDVLTLHQYQNSGGNLATGTGAATTTRFSGVWQSV